MSLNNNIFQIFTGSLAVLGALFVLACGEEPTQTIEPATSSIEVAWVISPAPGINHTYLVTLNDEAPTAYNAFVAMGLDFRSADFGFGLAICSIENTGPSAQEPCFGSDEDPFWAFFIQREGSTDWLFSESGLTAYGVEDGDVLGLAYTALGPNFSAEREPQQMTFSQIQTAQ